MCHQNCSRLAGKTACCAPTNKLGAMSRLTRWFLCVPSNKPCGWAVNWTVHSSCLRGHFVLFCVLFRPCAVGRFRGEFCVAHAPRQTSGQLVGSLAARHRGVATWCRFFSWFSSSCRRCEGWKLRAGDAHRSTYANESPTVKTRPRCCLTASLFVHYKARRCPVCCLVSK